MKKPFLIIGIVTGVCALGFVAYKLNIERKRNNLVQVYLGIQNISTVNETKKKIDIILSKISTASNFQISTLYDKLKIGTTQFTEMQKIALPLASEIFSI